MDRQHPRDLYDIKLLLDNEGITTEIRKAFLVYLISHPRPIVELLNPNEKDIETIWKNEFRGMTIKEVMLRDLIEARTALIRIIKETLTTEEKEFLINFKSKTPKWDLLGMEGIQELPAVKWKLRNLNKMSEEKHRAALKRLDDYLLSF